NRLKDARRMAGGDWQTEEERDYAYSVVLQIGPGRKRSARTRADKQLSGLFDLPSRASPSPDESSEIEGADLDAIWKTIPFATRQLQLAERALLSLKVCDPATGSGHFLIAAAHRIA